MKSFIFIALLVLLLAVGLFLQYIYPLDVKLPPQLQPTSVTNDITPYGMEASGSRGLVFGPVYLNGPDGWIFSHVNSEEYLVFYILKQDIDKGLLTVHAIYNGNHEITPILQGGTIFRSSDNNVYGPGNPQRQTTLTDIQQVDGSLILTYTENGRNKVTYTIFTKGKSLIMDIAADTTEVQYAPNYEGFTLGNGLVGHTATHTFVNYMSVTPVASVLDSSQKPLYFYSLYYDPTQTNGQWYKTNGCNKSTTNDPCYYSFTYAGRKNNQEVMPLKERIYLTVSNNVEDVMVKINNPVSPYKQTLQSKTQIDIYDETFTRALNNDALVLQWTADEIGSANINANIQRKGYEDCKFTFLLIESDGSNFFVKKNNIALNSQAFPPIDTSERDIQLTIPVVKGDKIQFFFSAENNYCEETLANINIELNNKNHNYPGDFSTLQGSNGWNYLEYLDEQLKVLSYDSSLNRWQTKEYRGYISNNVISPSAHNSFNYLGKFVDQLYYFGIEDFVFFYGRHAQNGFDVTFPDLYPSSDVKGGLDGIKQLKNKVASKNNLFSLYLIHFWLSEQFPQGSTQYFPLYKDQITRENSGQYRTTSSWGGQGFGFCPGGLDACFDLPGLPKLTCPFNGACYKGSTVYLLDYSKIVKSLDGQKPFVEIDSARFEDTVGLTAVFTDVVTSGSPTFSIDYYADDSKMRSVGEVIQSAKYLVQYIKTIHNSPLASEPSSLYGPLHRNLYQAEQRTDVLLAGYVDGMTLPPDFEKRDEIGLIPNFAHKSINTLMTPHGSGYKSRVFFDKTITDNDHDFYRALVLAHGYANYLEGQGVSTNNPLGDYHALMAQFVKEYYLMHSIQKAYVGVPVNKILYESQGELVDLSEALKRNVNFLDDKVYIEYSNGFRIYINYDRNSNWVISNTPKGTITLPTYGFVAWKQGELFAASYLNNGNKVDYVESNDYIMGDGRGTMTNFFNSLDSKYLTIKLNNGDIIICESALGCSKNQKLSSLSDLKTTVPAALLGTIQSIEIKGSNIHPNAQIMYQGEPVSNLDYKVLDSNTIYLFLHNQFPLGENNLIVRNPGEITGKLNLIVTDQACYDGDGDKFPIQLKSSVSCSVKLDCNDSDSSINPEAKEICGNSIDEDCSGSDLECSGGGNGGNGGGGNGGSGGTQLGKTIFVNLDNSNISVFNFTKEDIIKLTFNKTVYSIYIDSLVSNKVTLKISPIEKTISLNPNIWLDINLDESENNDIRFKVDEIYNTLKIKLRVENIIYLNGTRLKSNFTEDELDIDDPIYEDYSISTIFWIIFTVLVLGIASLIIVIIYLRKTKALAAQKKMFKSQYSSESSPIHI